MDFWEFEEFKKFAKSIDDPLYYRFFMFLYYTGARKGEARAMTWKQIDFKNNLITISRSLERRKDKNGNYIINRPKNGHSRTIMLNSELRDVLLTYYSERKRHFDFDEKEVFVRNKKPLADSTIENRKNKYCDKSGVKKIRIHDFRHSNVSLLVSLGAVYVLSVLVWDIKIEIRHLTDIRICFRVKKEKSWIKLIIKLVYITHIP